MRMAAVRCETRVIYGDTDQMGVVYYANYFRFFEKGRCETLRACGVSYADVEANGFILPVVDAHCSYKLPARFDDLLVIATTITRMTRIKVEFSYELLKKHDDGREELLASGSTMHASLDKSMRPARIPSDFVERMRPAFSDDEAVLVRARSQQDTNATSS
jgi:acyl-CoA thioester hydrolase